MSDMRVTGPSGTALVASPASARRASGGAFTLSEGSAPQAQSAAVALRTLGGIDALIALQGIEDPVERRRRAVRHGTRALDALDELKIGLLTGDIDQGVLLNSRPWRRTSRTARVTTGSIWF